MKGAVVLEPEAGLPPGADHVTVNGAVPPETVAEHVTGLPIVAAPQVGVIDTPPPVTVMVWELWTRTWFASVVFRVIVNVPPG